jgi:hypothetical protein
MLNLKRIIELIRVGRRYAWLVKQLAFKLFKKRSDGRGKVDPVTLFWLVDDAEFSQHKQQRDLIELDTDDNATLALPLTMTQCLSPLTMLLRRHTRRREFIVLVGGAAATSQLKAEEEAWITSI